MIVLIDNYDSFTYNLYQIIALYEKVKVFRNDKVSLNEIKGLNPSGIIISPGPGRPENAGIVIDIIKYFKDKCPILGVCLGHQAIAQAFGGTIIKAKEIVHGKKSVANIKQCKIFKGLREKEEVMRYHSLIVEKASLSPEMDITSETENEIIMGIKHKSYEVYGVQFHPESIYTKCGVKVIENFIKEVCDNYEGEY